MKRKIKGGGAKLNFFQLVFFTPKILGEVCIDREYFRLAGGEKFIIFLLFLSIKEKKPCKKTKKKNMGGGSLEAWILVYFIFFLIKIFN